MDPRIEDRLHHFQPLSLDQLNAKAAMLERIDNKYVVPAHVLAPALEAFAQSFDVLEIDGRRAFTYATRYFDDEARRAYYDHHQGRRKRCKVRIRTYVDAGFSFLEIKLKDKRDMTVKKRLKVATGQAALGQPGEDFVRACYGELYDAEFGAGLSPVLAMEYQRITLVAREGGERMTIDASLNFSTPDGSAGEPGFSVGDGLFILETKSARGNGLADRILRGFHQHPTARCSKYCVGMAATGQVARHNRFLPAMKKLGLAGEGARPAPAPVPQAGAARVLVSPAPRPLLLPPLFRRPAAQPGAFA